ncbi:MAG: anaerobic ribonucleoside-triphosphate reductase activating protein [[Eubacterium] siraeum]
MINYHNITCPDQNNGDGLRVVLWLSGCSHHCKGCQNPQTWDKNSGIKFDENAVEELLVDLKFDYISGITLTGGDPLNENNVIEVLNFLNKITVLFPQKTVWIYTGYTWEEIINPTIEDDASVARKEILKYCDVLVDGRYIDEQRDITLKWRGSKNQRVIDVQKSLQTNSVVLHCD